MHYRKDQDIESHPNHSEYDQTLTKNQTEVKKKKQSKKHFFKYKILTLDRKQVIYWSRDHKKT